MKFSDYKYERPIYEEVKKEFISIIDKINNSCTYEEQKENIKKLNILRNNVETMATLSSIRHSINTLDEFYEKEYIHKVITTNLNYKNPDILTRPYYLEADMSKYLASIMDILNHDLSVEKVRSTTEKINQLLHRYS